MCKVIITGGAGFIGAHLAEEIKRLGYEVEIVDIAIDPKRDVRKLEALRPIFKGAKYIFHLAALPSVSYSIEHPAETNETNLTGTLNVLIAAKETGVKRVIFSSSAAVYGDQEQLPVKENVVLWPKSPYAIQKLASELYLKHFADIKSLETVSLRYFNVYGEGQNAHGPYASAIPIFIEQKKGDKSLTIVDDGKQTRDFVNIKDVVTANILAMESQKVGGGESINIASGEAVSINEIAKIIGGKVEHLPPRLEIKNSLADISLAKKLLNWEPKVKLADGLRELLK